MLVVKMACWQELLLQSFSIRHWWTLIPYHRTSRPYNYCRPCLSFNRKNRSRNKEQLKPLQWGTPQPTALVFTPQSSPNSSESIEKKNVFSSVTHFLVLDLVSGTLQLHHKFCDPKLEFYSAWASLSWLGLFQTSLCQCDQRWGETSGSREMPGVRSRHNISKN